MLTEPLTYVLGTLGITLVVLLIVLLRLQLRNSARINRLTYPAYEYTIEKSQDEARTIVWEAKEHARKLLLDAELAGIQIIAKEKLESRAVEKDYQNTLANFAGELRERLDEHTTDAAKHYDALLDEVAGSAQAGRARIEERLGAVAGDIEQIAQGLTERAEHMEQQLRESAERAGEDLQKTLGAIGQESRERITEHLDREFEAANKQIEEYRRKRVELIDAQIVSLVERTAKIALGKELSVDEHAELVHRALREAKERGVFSA